MSERQLSPIVLAAIEKARATNVVLAANEARKRALVHQPKEHKP